MTVLDIIIGLSGGLLAGFINTLAGNGSAITLSILTEIFGLPGNVANATNRVGITSQSLFSTVVFYKDGKIKLQTSKIILTVILIGSFFGLWVALRISNEAFKEVFKYLMLFMLIFVLIKPKRWIENKKDQSKISLWLLFPLYFLLGIYGGFIQMGMGIWFLIVAVLLSKMDIITANALKSFVILLYTAIILGIFHFRGMVHWEIGLLLAIGQSIGGFFTARIATRYKYANELAYWVLIVAILGALIKMFFFS